MRISCAFFVACTALAVLLTPAPVRAGDPVRIEGWDQAQKQFEKWQVRMLKEHEERTPELRRIMRHKVVVPVPEPATPDATPSIPLQFGSLFGPQLYPGMLPGVEIVIGPPSAQLSVNAEAGAGKLVLFKHKIGVAYSGKRNALAFVDVAEAKAQIEEAGLKGELGGEYQLFGHDAGEAGPSGELAMNFGAWSVGAGVTPDGEAAFKGAYGLKTPGKGIGKLVRLEGNVELELATEIKGVNVQYGSEYGLAQVSAKAARALERLLAARIPCPYCAQAGEISCRQCGDTRTIPCDRCSGSGEAPCDRCGGTGQRSCPTTESCDGCNGRGHLNCGTCGGSGRVTEYVEVQKSRQVLVIDQVGFDSNGDPIYNRHYETQYYTAVESQSVSCSSCGGSGNGGVCGSCGGSGRQTCSRCGGAGWVTCGTCDGTGRVACGRCGGSGRLTCPTCRGSAIRCPLCRGKRSFGGNE